MDVQITNLYSNEVSKVKNLKGDHGQAFYIKVNNESILMDTGSSAEILLHNMNELKISPESIDKIFISHGHYDHTFALPGFLDAMNSSKPIPIIGHPGILESKIGKLAFLKKNIGFPEFSDAQREKIDLQLTTESIPLAQGIISTGEISNRSFKDGTEPNAFHIVNGELEADPVVDDQSIVLDTTDGLVVVTGCCHAGLLNTLDHVRTITDKKVSTIIGGTHMVRYSSEEVSEVADILEKKYFSPTLYLNHCTDYLPKPMTFFIKKTKVTQLLQRRFGTEKVKICNVGTTLSFEI